LFSTSPFDTQVASSVTAIAQEATTDINAGNTDAKKGKWGRAYGAFQDALRKMKETQDSMNTRRWLKNSFGIGFGASTSATSSTSTVQISSSTNQSNDDSDDSDN